MDSEHLSRQFFYDQKAAADADMGRLTVKGYKYMAVVTLAMFGFIGIGVYACSKHDYFMLGAALFVAGAFAHILLDFTFVLREVFQARQDLKKFTFEEATEQEDGR